MVIITFYLLSSPEDGDDNHCDEDDFLFHGADPHFLEDDYHFFDDDD